MRPPLEALVPDWLRAAMAKEPAFRVLTMDGTGWIDPYTAAVVPTPFGYDAVAKRHLVKTRPWERYAVKPLAELLAARWLHYLRAHLEFVPQLRTFSRGQWLNPYTGHWVAAVPLDGAGRVNVGTITAMAQILAACPEAQTGRMLERDQLDGIAAEGPLTGRIARPATAGREAPRNSREALRNSHEVPRSTSRAASSTTPRAQPVLPPAQSSPHTTPRPLRASAARKTDFHQVKQGLVKMLARPPRLDGFQMVVHYEPNAPITRDFYDIIPLSKQRLLLTVGSVEGDGPGLALFPAITLTSLRTVATATPSLIEMAVRLQDAVRPDLHQDCRIALLLVVLDQDRRTATCLGVGHPPALLLNPAREATLSRIGTPGLALGASNADGLRRQLRPLTLQLDRGDILLLHTGGLARAANAKRESYGAYRFFGTCVAHLGRPVKELVTDVAADVRAHAGGRLIEDLTLLGLRVKDADGEHGDALHQTWLGRMPE